MAGSDRDDSAYCDFFANLVFTVSKSAFFKSASLISFSAGCEMTGPIRGRDDGHGRPFNVRKAKSSHKKVTNWLHRLPSQRSLDHVSNCLLFFQTDMWNRSQYTPPPPKNPCPPSCKCPAQTWRVKQTAKKINRLGRRPKPVWNTSQVKDGEKMKTRWSLLRAAEHRDWEWKVESKKRLSWFTARFIYIPETWYVGRVFRERPRPMSRDEMVRTGRG